MFSRRSRHTNLRNGAWIIIIIAFLFLLVLVLLYNDLFGNYGMYQPDLMCKYETFPDEVTVESFNSNQNDGFPKIESIIHTSRKPIQLSSSNPSLKKTTIDPTVVVIGAVNCRNGTDKNYNEGTAVMLKSVLISAKLYGVDQVDIHLFLEHITDDELYFRGKLKSFGYHSKNNYTDKSGLKIRLLIHSAQDAVPKMYHNPMIYHHRYRCAWVRFFFPTALPKVDAIIHLDSDMIITGSIKTLWDQFYLMTGEQLVGAARGNEVEDRHYLQTHAKWFGGNMSGVV